jgi:hypothetical protein
VLFSHVISRERYDMDLGFLWVDELLMLSDLECCFEAVHDWHVDIHEYDFDVLAIGDKAVICFLAVGRRDDLEGLEATYSYLLYYLNHDFKQEFLVVNQEKFRSWTLGWWLQSLV